MRSYYYKEYGLYINILLCVGKEYKGIHPNVLELGNVTAHGKEKQIIEFQYKITSKNHLLSSGSMALEYAPVPMNFKLNQPYPNPFNPTTKIDFSIPMDAHVRVTILDLQGRNMETLLNNDMKQGYHSVTWNASEHASGVYFVKMVTDKYTHQEKLMLIK